MNRPKKKRYRKRSIKNVINVLIIAFAIIAFWRGVWGILDELLFPNNYLLSSIVSIVIGVVILYFTKHLMDELA